MAGSSPAMTTRWILCLSLSTSRVLKKCRFWRVLASAMIGMAVADAFCGRSNGRGRGSSARFDVYAGSLDSLSEQFGQADKVVGGHREGELPIDLEQPAMPHLAHAGHRLGPAEGLLDAFADALRDHIARMTGDAIIDRRAASVGTTPGAIREGAPSVADGPRHPDRGGARRDARGRPASALFGGYTEGPFDAFGEASDRQAVATGTTRCTGQAIGARGRALRLGAKPRPCRQRAGAAAAAGEAVVDAAE